jgi:hypothetical protein
VPQPKFCWKIGWVSKCLRNSNCVVQLRPSKNVLVFAQRDTIYSVRNHPPRKTTAHHVERRWQSTKDLACSGALDTNERLFGSTSGPSLNLGLNTLQLRLLVFWAQGTAGVSVGLFGHFAGVVPVDGNALWTNDSVRTTQHNTKDRSETKKHTTQNAHNFYLAYPTLLVTVIAALLTAQFAHCHTHW